MPNPVLTQAVDETLQDRNKTHGDFKFQCEITNRLKETVGWGDTGKITSWQKEALDMICVKMGRILAGNPCEPDHWHDIAGYARLVEKEVLNDQVDLS